MLAGFLFVFEEEFSGAFIPQEGASNKSPNDLPSECSGLTYCKQRIRSDFPLHNQCLQRSDRD